jgi:hypothetical protein
MTALEDRNRIAGRDLDQRAARIAAAACLILVVLLALCIGAHGHDSGPGAWISNGHFTSPIDGSHCCGPADCFLVPSEEVSERHGGYYLKAFDEVVPFAEVQASRDGSFWRCKRPDGSRRCFFAPPPST